MRYRAGKSISRLPAWQALALRELRHGERLKLGALPDTFQVGRSGGLATSNCNTTGAETAGISTNGEMKVLFVASDCTAWSTARGCLERTAEPDQSFAVGRPERWPPVAMSPSPSLRCYLEFQRAAAEAPRREYKAHASPLPAAIKSWMVLPPTAAGGTLNLKYSAWSVRNSGEAFHLDLRSWSTTRDASSGYSR